MLVEGSHRIGQKPSRLQEVMDNDRFEHIELKIALARCEADRSIVAHYLTDHHRQRLALRWIDFSRHDRAARFILRNMDLPNAASWPACQPADIIGDLHQIGRQSFEGAMNEHDLVMACQRVEFIRRAYKGFAR